MADVPTTRTSLLLRIRDHTDVDGWREFTRIYGPVVYQYGRKRGLQDADAEDLTQAVLQAVADGIGRLEYDRGRGSFRGWLFTLAHHKLYDLRGRLQRQAQGSGDSEVHEQLAAQPAQDADEALWQAEYEKRLFEWAAEKARDTFQETTWRAFWMTAVEGQSGQDVAQALGMTVAAVYIAKSRVMARLREELIEHLEGS